VTKPLISYLPPIGAQPAPSTPPPSPQSSGAHKYVGAVAAGYDAKRDSSAKWKVEQAAVESFLDDMPAGSVILDAPCGTGRFFPFYERKGFAVRGLDVSADMIRQAAAKITNANAMVGDVAQWMFAQGDVRGTSLPDKSFDATVNVRITRWLMGEHGPEGVVDMLKEMQRLARKRVILTARVANHPFACTYETIESALDGWKVTRDVPGGKDTPEGPAVDEAYRVIMLEPA